MKRLMKLRSLSVVICILCMNGYWTIQAADSEHRPITKKLITLLKKKPEIAEMLKASINKAKRINPDEATNPVGNLDDYLTFIDQASELIPQQILNNPENLTRDQILQSICYFYFIVGQEIPALKRKGLYKSSLQYYPPFSEWLRAFAETWGAFLDTEKSWSKKTYQQFLADPRFGLRKNWYESPLKWHTFNRFFSRCLRSPSVRPIADPNDDSVVTSPADSVPQGIWNIDFDSKIQVDGGLKVKLATYCSVKDLLAEESKYKDAFENGILTHTFLNINDYHRFHFPLSGIIREKKIISQNVALEVSWDKTEQKYQPVDSTGWQFSQTRGYVILDTGKYGLVALIPMGMAQVSSVNFEKSVIVGSRHKKGDMLGYFLFGGSDFIMIFQKVAGFELLAPREDSKSFKHILVGEKYGSLRGNKQFIAKQKEIFELDEFARSLKMPPLSQVDKTVTKEQVEMMIYKEIKASDLPEFNLEAVKKAAEARYKLWKIGDKVKTVDAHGYTHEGELKEKNGRYVKIGTVKIFTVDISESMLSHLNEKHQQLAVDEYISSRKKIYYQKKRNHREQIRDSVKSKYYKKYGFVHHAYKWLDYETYYNLLKRSKERRDKKRALMEAKKREEADKNANQ